MTVTLLLAGALLSAVGPAREVFDRVPAELDLQQRARTALDHITQAIRLAGIDVALSEPDESGRSTELAAIVPIPAGALGHLEVDQGSADGALTLATTPCPNVKDVCGFIAGSLAMISDADGHDAVFVIASTQPGSRRLFPAAPMSEAYPAGSIVREVDRLTFRLEEQPDQSYSLVRETAAGAIQPIVDFVSGLSFTLADDHIVISIAFADRVFASAVQWRNGHDR